MKNILKFPNGKTPAQRLMYEALGYVKTPEEITDDIAVIDKQMQALNESVTIIK